MVLGIRENAMGTVLINILQRPIKYCERRKGGMRLELLHTRLRQSKPSTSAFFYSVQLKISVAKFSER